MADFDGEDILSDDELTRINAARGGGSPGHPVGRRGAHARRYPPRGGHHHMQQHLANMASAYHKHDTSEFCTHT